INLAAEDIPLHYSNRSPGNYIMLRIEDNGSGMDHHTLEKIFDPFYTTKTMDKGTGLGLSTVQGIVEQHGGLINVHSELGQGSIFELYFPAIAGKAASNLLKVEADLPRGTESILLIDDDKMVLELGNNILMSLGYQVSAMIDSTKALKLFAANPNKFELVITDQTMPGLTGKDLITELQKIRPDIRTILITGFSNKITREQAEEQGIGAFLMKPLDLPELAQTIRAVLATRNS
ncbi:MAG: response regulator, partial [Thermodesulfobacteriota bacterium]|nr:response regulator [Thermodesulfobacteriota bacterium]